MLTAVVAGGNSKLNSLDPGVGKASDDEDRLPSRFCSLVAAGTEVVWPASLACVPSALV